MTHALYAALANCSCWQLPLPRIPAPRYDPRSRLPDGELEICSLHHGRWFSGAGNCPSIARNCANEIAHQTLPHFVSVFSLGIEPCGNGKCRSQLHGGDACQHSVAQAQRTWSQILEITLFSSEFSSDSSDTRAGTAGCHRARNTGVLRVL